MVGWSIILYSNQIHRPIRARYFTLGNTSVRKKQHSPNLQVVKMSKNNLKERTLVIIKPDALQRHLLGEIVSRFERKGLKIAGMKMMRLSDILLNKHYRHHKDKVFFVGLKKFMKSAPVIVTVLEGLEAIRVVRLVVGPTSGRNADAGSIRGDLCISTQTNIVHASDSSKSAKAEIKRFFKTKELFNYKIADFDFVYGEEERS